jgi:hypothetical protein
LGLPFHRNLFFEAYYEVADRTAKQKKPHTIGETLVKPGVLEIVKLVCGLEQRKKLEAVPLSNDVIRSGIFAISFSILKNVTEEWAASPFPSSMQLDETTDISQCSQLLVFVRYLHADVIKEGFLFCEPLLETTKAVDVLQIVKGFFAKKIYDWKEKLHTLSIDVAPAMPGNTSGFATLVKEELLTHCFLLRYALATKTTTTTLKEVLSTAIKVINFIR